jgi:3-phenylpropionate/trans-cinnamate dioxygenase ferredoxin subunit
MWQELAKLDDIAPGGMKYVRVGEREICLCRVGDDAFAVARRCGHQNAPLDQGALDGGVLTCPLHDAQFDVRTGKNLSWAIDHDYGPDPLPEPVTRFFALETRLSWKTRIHDLHTYQARVVDGAVEVDVPEA